MIQNYARRAEPRRFDRTSKDIVDENGRLIDPLEVRRAREEKNGEAS